MSSPYSNILNNTASFAGQMIDYRNQIIEAVDTHLNALSIKNFNILTQTEQLEEFKAFVEKQATIAETSHRIYNRLPFLVGRLESEYQFDTHALLVNNFSKNIVSLFQEVIDSAKEIQKNVPNELLIANLNDTLEQMEKSRLSYEKTITKLVKSTSPPIKTEREALINELFETAARALLEGNNFSNVLGKEDYAKMQEVEKFFDEKMELEFGKKLEDLEHPYKATEILAIEAINQAAKLGQITKEDAIKYEIITKHHHADIEGNNASPEDIQARDNKIKENVANAVIAALDETKTPETQVASVTLRKAKEIMKHQL